MWSSIVVQCMSNERKRELREEARDMFYHGYQAYMENAYPGTFSILYFYIFSF